MSLELSWNLPTDAGSRLVVKVAASVSGPIPSGNGLTMPPGDTVTKLCEPELLGRILDVVEDAAAVLAELAGAGIVGRLLVNAAVWLLRGLLRPPAVG
ncbi:hypothetical protein [Saccharopolyspora phatthalungensis]|uniref:Uncharacterized protein n=1 Tax=Saccharopolyspora phatthalungensis TaxID=664693 RepID=A0A840QKR4_9PSEU|nr:hypothetical protein [Saccharopolyspora phatthalungensis]MBB5159233.1 hypothetical protein [Saccharopolyspora phatthalungensis]